MYSPRRRLRTLTGSASTLAVLTAAGLALAGAASATTAPVPVGIIDVVVSSGIGHATISWRPSSSTTSVTVQSGPGFIAHMLPGSRVKVTNIPSNAGATVILTAHGASGSVDDYVSLYETRVDSSGGHVGRTAHGQPTLQILDGWMDTGPSRPRQQPPHFANRHLLVQMRSPGHPWRTIGTTRTDARGYAQSKAYVVLKGGELREVFLGHGAYLGSEGLALRP
jgi:hypothetical protein